jgi:hypothetical protein
VLRHERDPRVSRVAWAPELGRVPVPQDLAGVGREASRGDRDERRLAGPVLPEERVNLAGKDDESCF